MIDPALASLLNLVERCLARIEKADIQSVERVGRILKTHVGEEARAFWIAWIARVNPRGFDAAGSDRLREEWDGFAPALEGICSLIRMAGDDPTPWALERLGTAPAPGMALDAEERARAVRWLAEALGVPIERWIQRGIEAGCETYYVRIAGVAGDVAIGDAGSLRRYEAVADAILAQSRHVLDVGKKLWSELLRWIAAVLEIHDEPDATRAGRIREIVESYIEQFPGGLEETDDAVRNRQPFLRGGCLFVSAPALEEQLAIRRIRWPALRKSLRAEGWERETVSANGTTRSYYRVPLDSISAPPVLAKTKRGGEIGS